MAKRVYEIAKELGLSSREVIAALSGLGVVAKSHSSTVEEAVVSKLKDAGDKGSLQQLVDKGKTARTARPRRAARAEERPAAERTAAERPPARPLAGRPPAQRPPAERPPAERPPAQRPPAERPPAERPPAARPAEPAPTPAAPAPAAESPAAPSAGNGAGTVTATKELTVERGITVGDFAGKIDVSPAEIIKKLFLLGEQYTVAQSLTDEAAELVATDYGYELTIVAPEEQDLVEEKDEEDAPESLKPRPPVITVMGHVDHGKTLLLDKIRETDVVAQEHGGITQHIGAYQVHKNERAITFIDTPGHEAFTQMRARGAQATDIAVLVVAANDGVMPQTLEALSHAKAAEVPIVVAVNKVDLEDANPQRVRQQLTEQELIPEEWGGDTPFVDVSAKTGQSLEDLLDVLLLVADIQELKANPEADAGGVVIEAHLDRGRGPVATVLVQRGTLRAGDALVCGSTWAKVRAMLDDTGEQMKEAQPGVPAQVLGFESVPNAGDEFRVVDEKRARQIADEREHKQRTADLISRKRVTLEDLYESAQEGELTELNVVLKADVHGSLEAVQDALEKLQIEEVQVRVIHRAVGAIAESDIRLADASNAIVIGFNVRPSPQARALAESTGVDVRLYQIIYNLMDEVESALKGMLKPVFREVVTGRAEVRAVFKVPRIGKVAGSHVEEGIITRGAKVRLVREGIIVADSTVSSLRRFKDDVREVQQGFECGIGIEDYQDIKEGDVLECYEIREIPRD